MEYQNIDTYESISFVATDDELEYFYNFLKEAMNDKIGKKIEIGESQIFAKKQGKSVLITNMTQYEVRSNFCYYLKN